MPPRMPVVNGCRLPVRLGATANGHAGPSRLSTSLTKTKKRDAEVVSDEEEDGELEINGDGLDIPNDEEPDANFSEGGSEDEEGFPELDSGSDEDEDGERIPGDEESDSDSDGIDDEDSGSESGYNSSDIEQRYGSSPSTSMPPSPSYSSHIIKTDEKLSRMISKSTVKPDESVGTDARISDAKEGHGRLVRSRLVDGGYKREYEDVEAGYGSESSTEDVSIPMIPSHLSFHCWIVPCATGLTRGS